MVAQLKWTTVRVAARGRGGSGLVKEAVIGLEGGGMVVGAGVVGMLVS